MLTFNDKGIPVYEDPATSLHTEIDLAMKEAEAQGMVSNKSEFESIMNEELQQAEASIRDKYRDKYGADVVGDTDYNKALKDFLKRV